MKLHLPKLLRNAVLACITAVAGIATTTVGTATFAGGVVAFAISQQQALAEMTGPENVTYEIVEWADSITLTDAMLGSDKGLEITMGQDQNAALNLVVPEGQSLTNLKLKTSEVGTWSSLVTPLDVDNLWLAQGRYKAAADNAGLFTNIGTVYVGAGQLWFTGAAHTVANTRLIIGTSTFAEDTTNNAGLARLNHAALRVSNNLTLNGGLEIAEDTKIAFQSGANLTVNGSFVANGALVLDNYDVGSQSTVQFNAFTGDFEGAVTIQNNTKITLNVAKDLEFKQGLTLDKGTFYTCAGATDGRTMDLNTLTVGTGGGTLVDTNWNVIWNIDNLTGAGNLTWRAEGTHWSPNVMIIKGGSDYTGLFTLNRIANNQNSANGAYQAVVQINEAGKDAFAQAGINLTGPNANHLATLALNAADGVVTLGSLEGNANSYIFAGEAPQTEKGNGSAPATALGSVKPESTHRTTLSLNTSGEKSFLGTIASGVDITMTGAGYQYIQSLEEDADRVITATKGTLCLLGLTSAGRIEANGGQVILDYHMDVSREDSFTWGNDNSGQYYKASVYMPDFSAIEIEGDVVLRCNVLEAQGNITDLSSNVVTWFDATGYESDTMEVRGGLLSVFNPTTGAAANFGTVENIILNNAGLVSSSPLHHGATDPGINLTQNLEIVGTSYLRAGGNQDDAAETDGSYNTVLSGAISGSGNLVKIGDGTFTLSGDMSGFTGNLNVQAGKLKLVGDAHASTININGGVLDTTGTRSLEATNIVVTTLNTTMKGNITINGNDSDNRGLRLVGTGGYDAATGTITTPNLIITGEDTVVTTYRLNLGDDGSKVTRLDITDGALVNVNGTSWNGGNQANQDSFLLAHWSGARGEVNIENATLNILKSGFTVVDSRAESAVLNIKAGGILNIAALSRRGGASSDKAIVQLEAGGTINIGSFGIARHEVNGTGTSGDFTFNINGGKLGILSSADSWATYKALELNGDLTINTEKYDAVAEKYTGGAGLITLNGTVTTGEHSLIKDGEGTLILGAEVMGASNLVVNKGAITLAAGATSLKIGSLSMTDGVIRLTAGQSLTLGAAASGDICFVLDVDGITFEEGVNTKKITVADGDYKPATAVVECLTSENVSATYADGVVTLTKSNTPLVAGNLTWKTDGSTNEWSSSTIQNWTADGAVTRFVNGSTVTFGDDTTSQGELVSIQGTVTPAGMTVNGKGWQFGGTGSIAGEGGLSLAEGASLTVSTANSYTGGTTIGAGAELTITKKLALGGSDNKLGNVSGTGTLVIDLAGGQTVKAIGTGDSASLNGFTGTVEVRKGELQVGENQGNKGGTDATFDVQKVIVHDGATLITHFGQNGTAKNLYTNLDLMSGSTVSNIDGHVTYNASKDDETYKIRFNIIDPSASGEDARYDEKGVVKFDQYWQKTISFGALLEGDGIVQFANAEAENTAEYIFNNNGNTFCGTYETIDDNGTGTGRVIALKLNAENAAKNADIKLSSTQAKSYVYLMTDAAVNGLYGVVDNENAVLASGGAARTLTVQKGDFGGCMDDNGNTLSLTKTGKDTLTLRGTMAYTGATTVIGGKLEYTGTGALTLGSISTVGSAQITTASALTLAAGASLSMDMADASTDNALISVGAGQFALTSETCALTLSSTDQLEKGTYTLLSWAETNENLTIDKFVVSGVTLGESTGYSLALVDNALVLTKSQPVGSSLHWIKGEGTWSVDSELDIDGAAGGATQAFANRDRVTFGNLTEDATITISGTTAAPLTAGAVTVDAADKTYTFAAGSGEGVNGQLTTFTLDVTSGTAKFNNGSLNFGALETITVDGVLDLTDVNGGERNVTSFLKKLSIATGDGEIRLGKTDAIWAKIAKDANAEKNVLSYGVDLKVNGGFEVLPESGDLEFNVGKKITVVSTASEGDDRLGQFRLGRNTTMTVQNGGSIDAAGALELAWSSGDNANAGTAVELGAGGSIKVSAIKQTNNGTAPSSFTMTGGTLELTDTDGIASTITTTITGGTVQTGDNSWGISGATIGGATIANTQVADTAAEGGKRAGTGVITLENATLTSGLTVTGNAQFKGAITLAKGYTPTAQDGVRYVNGTNTNATSGYKTVDNVYSLSALGEDGAKLSTGTMTEFQDASAEAADTTWSVVVTDVNGEDKTITGGVFNGTDKTVTFAGVETTEFWVRADSDASTDDTVTYAGTDSNFAKATALVLDGGTLKLTTALDGNLVAEGGSGIKLNSSGTIEIYDATPTDENKVVLQASQISRVTGNTTATVTLTGNGVYELASGNITLGGIATLKAATTDANGTVTDAGWTGTVKVSNANGGLNNSKPQLNFTSSFNDLCKGTSKVEVTGVSGYFNAENKTDTTATNYSANASTANIVLVNAADGTAALKIGNGFSVDADADKLRAIISGAISGTGDMEFIGWSNIDNRYLTYLFNGNLTNWTGSFINNSSYGNITNLLFETATINTSIVNATTKQADAKTYVTIGGTSSVTMNGLVNVDKLTVDQITSFTNDVTATEIINNATSTTTDTKFASGKTLKATSLTNNGTLSLAGTTTVSSLTNNAGKTATVAAGSTLKAVTVTNAGTMTVNGTLAVDDAVASNVLDVTNSGTLSLANDTTLGTLANSGTLTATGKTLTVTGGITGVTTVTGESATTAYGSIAAGALTLQAAANNLSALTLTGALTLGKADAASALTVNGAMSVAEVQVNNLGNAITAASLTSTALNISITEALLTKLLGTEGKSMTLLTLTADDATINTSILQVNGNAYDTEVISDNEQFSYFLKWDATNKVLTLQTELNGTTWDEGKGTRWNAASLVAENFTGDVIPASGFGGATSATTSVVIEPSNEAMPQDFIVVNGAVEANNLTVDRWGVEYGDFTISAGEDTDNPVADSITVYQDMLVNGNRNLIIGDAVAADGAEGLALNVHHNLTINESAGLIVAANAALTVGVADDPETEDDETAAGKLTVNGKFSNVGDVDVNGDVTIAENAYLYSGVMALTGAPFGDKPSSIDITGKVTNKGNLINYALGNVTIGAAGTLADPTSLVNTGSVVVNGGTVTINGSMDNAEAGSLTVGSAENYPASEVTVTGALNNTSGSIAIGSAAVADDPATEDTNESAAATYGTLTVGGKLDNTSGSISIVGAESSLTVNGALDNQIAIGFSSGDPDTTEIEVVGGDITIDENATVTVGGSVDNTAGSISIAGGSSLTVGTETTPADLVNGAGSLDVIGGTLAVTGDLDNQISCVINDGNGNIISSDITGGTITIVEGGVVTVDGDLDNTNGSIVVGTAGVADDPETEVDEFASATTGSLTVGGALDNTSGSLSIVGAESSLTVNGALDNTNGGVAGAVGGSITIDEGATVTVDGALDNTSGSINIDGGSSLTVGTTTANANLTNTGGSITIGTAAVKDNPETEVDETAAATTGSLTVNGNLTHAGENATLTVESGSSLEVGGDLTATDMKLAFGGDVQVGGKATIGDLTNDGSLTVGKYEENADGEYILNDTGKYVLAGEGDTGKTRFALVCGTGGGLDVESLHGAGDVTVGKNGVVEITNSADFTGKLTNYGKIVMTPVVDDEGNETTPSFTISESTEQGGDIEAPVLVIGGQMKDVVDEAGNVVIDPDTQEAVQEYESASGTVLGEVVTDEIRFDNMELVVQDHPTDSTQKIEAPILTMTSIASTAEGTDAAGDPIQKDIKLHFTQLESAEGVTSLVQDLSTWFEPDTEGNVRETVTITLLAVQEIAENVSGFVLAADYAEHEEFAEYYQQLLSAGYKLSNLKDPLNPEVVTFALRNTPVYQEVTIDVQKQTVEDATWTVENDKLTTDAGLVIGTVTDGTVKLAKNSILDNVQSVVVKQNIAIDLTGNAPDEEVDDQGNLVKPVEVNIHGLTGDKNLTIRGENTGADVVNIDVASYDGQLVLNKVNATVQGSAANKPAWVKGGIRLTTDTLADLNVKDTVVDATDGGVVLKGNMENGSLKLDIGEKLDFQSGSAPLAAGSTLIIDGTALDIAYDDKGATTMDMTGVSKTGQVLVKMSGMTGSAGDIVIGKDGVQSALLDKYFSGIRFDEDKNAVVADRNTSYYSDLVSGVEVTSNGMAGMVLADAALLNLNPQVEMQGGGLATMLDAIEKAAADGRTDELDHLGAALAGASSAVLGMAAHGDLDRQLQAIRNRTTTMGVDQSVVHPEIPYFNAWINAEGDYRELSDNGAEGGYKLSSWGGTVGFDVDCSPTVTAGLAFTAMYGDLTVTGADDAHGDFDTYYLSAFARYCASAWTHTFVATLGTTDFAMERTVMDSKQEYTTSGTSFGLMYELGRVYALDEDATSCIQPVFNITWRHTSVDGYQEDGNDLALEVDSQTLNTVTLGLGARVQAIVGENMYNRASIFECRLFAKADIGDRRSSTEVNLAGGTAEIESAEVGALGLEAGAGLTIPLGDGGSSLFMDASVELRADYTNVNGTVGYRVNF